MKLAYVWRTQWESEYNKGVSKCLFILCIILLSRSVLNNFFHLSKKRFWFVYSKMQIVHTILILF